MKQIPITPDIRSKIEAVVGEGVDVSGFAVYETIAANTRPFTGFRGTLNEAATLSYLTLQQAADLLQAGQSVPMLWDHNKSGLPVGRAFWGEIVAAADGEAELRILFYIDGTEPQLQAKIDAGSIDEVSVSITTTQMLCSECGWDYAGPDAELSHLLTQTCANDHVIAENGVHLMRNGLDKFIELSLVTRGAANGAKIQRRVDQKLAGSTQLTRLAARGFDPEALVLRATANHSHIKKDPQGMDLKELNAQLVDSMVEARTAQAEVTALTAKVASTEAELTAAQAEVTRLTNELAAAKAEKPEAAELTAAVTWLKDVYVRTLTAAGKAPKADEVPAEVPALLAGINEHQASLTAIITPGGVAAGMQDDTSNTPARVNTRAYTGK